jgi:hypothetical protein
MKAWKKDKGSRQPAQGEEEGARLILTFREMMPPPKARKIVLRLAGVRHAWVTL